MREPRRGGGGGDGRREPRGEVRETRREIKQSTTQKIIYIKRWIAHTLTHTEADKLMGYGISASMKIGLIVAPYLISLEPSCRKESTNQDNEMGWTILGLILKKMKIFAESD